LWYYLKRYGHTPRHRFDEQLLWVDVDVTPLPIGTQAEGSERTWMGRNRSKTGRKTLRVTASAYREILHETLLRGKASAVPALKAALGNLETRLGWTREQRQRIVLRLDASHFVRRQHSLADFSQGGRLPVQRGQVGHFRIGQYIRFRIEPVATLVRFEVGLLLKTARHGARKWS
jgi:hypothetical protein